MTRILIIEDEAPARRKLKRFLEDLEEPVSVLAELATVEEAKLFLNQTKDIDVIFSDIELLDGNAFEIYNEISPSCPIIFTTAYNEFLLDAFDTNGIAYLLKPFSFERFKKAWEKFKMLKVATSNQDNDLLKQIGNLLLEKSAIPQQYRTRLSVNTAKGTYFLEIANVVFFEADNGLVFANDDEGKRHLLNEATLKELEEVLDANCFFKISRAEIVNKNYVIGTERYQKNALAVKLKGYDKSLLTSQSNTSAFKSWVEQ